MQPPFTDCTRTIIQTAQREARNLNQEFVGTEHLALSLLHVTGCEAVRQLRANHVNPETARTTLLAMMPKAAHPPVISGDLPLSPKAQRAINGSIVIAQSLRLAKISTRALLLSIIEESGAPVATALREAGGDMDGLQQALRQPTTDSET